MMIQTIGASCKRAPRIFSRSFSLYRSPETRLEVRETRSKRRKTSLEKNFESPERQIPTYNDSNDRSHPEEHLEFGENDNFFVETERIGKYM